MIHKQVLPESFDFGMPSVELIGVGSKGLDKTAMVKRASTFDDVLDKLEKKANRTYLHVITTGAFEKYGANANGDAFNATSIDLDIPCPEDGKTKLVKLGGGLEKYHDDTYMKDGAVYQEHQTKRAGVDPSGEIVCARYNPMMKRGELLIAVDTNKWAPRLQKKAQGKDIYLSMGCDVPHDLCFTKGTLVLTDLGYKDISEVGVGDLVKTASGNIRPVEATSTRYTTELTRINTMGFPLEIECTTNHPFQIIKASQLRSCQGSANGKKRRHTTDGAGRCVFCGRQVDLTGSWVQASEIRQDDYLKIKVDSCAATDTVGTSFAYLCGMYLGDGCLITGSIGNSENHGVLGTQLTGISISCSGAADDADIVSRIKEAFHRTTGKDAYVRQDGDKNAFVVSLYDKLLAFRIFALCGAGSHTKYIDNNILGWSASEKTAFLAGYLDADGNVAPDYSQVRIATVNRGMALATQRMFWSLGMHSTVYLGNNASSYKPGSGFKHAGHCYMAATRDITPELARASAKLSRNLDLVGRKMNGATVMLDDGYAYVRVTAVRSFSCDHVAVYNIQVAEDHTYNAEGADVHNCQICGRVAKTASQHCDHFTKHRGQLYDCGKVACVMNDSPHFYDISGVDVPADRIAFVLQKVASGTTTKEASFEAITTLGSRKPILLTKSAYLLSKLSKLEKQVQGIIEGDKVDTEDLKDSEEAKKDFILKVENYPSDEVIDSCNRKGILLSPEMLFKILGNDCDNVSDKAALCSCDDDSCGDLSCMMQELDEDDDKNTELLDGSFDQHMPADLNLDSILESFMPEFGVTTPAIQAKVIKITISNKKPGKKEDKQDKKAAFNKYAQEALRKTYARYLISFADQNSDETCRNALLKIASYCK